MTTRFQSTPTSRNTSAARFAICMAALLGCATLSHAAPGTATTMPSAAASESASPVSDSWITTKVKAEILANSLSKGFKVSVTTKQGVVALEGKLPDQNAILLVTSIAETVKGVKRVDASGLVIGN